MYMVLLYVARVAPISIKGSSNIKQNHSEFNFQASNINLITKRKTLTKTKMCQQEVQNFSKTTNTQDKLKPTYSIKKVLKMLFKKHHQQQQQQQQKCSLPLPKQQLKMAFSLESIESWENLRNAQVEEEQFYEEIDDNYINEKLANMTTAVESQVVEEEEQDIYVPVRFARTTAGTFFWTTNLQPAFVTNMPAADEDLVQPAYCYSTSQYPHMQFQDRWAQA